jgi:hypothetical protein
VTYSIRLHSIKCVRESDENSASDEPYVLVTTIDLTPPSAVTPPSSATAPIITPTPDHPVITRIYGEWPNFDENEILDLVGERPFWGTFTEPWEPADIGNPDNVCFIVSVMEHDHGNLDRFRGAVQSAAALSLASTFALQRQARVVQLIADIRSVIGLFDAPTLDNHVDTKELRLDALDLAIPPGSSKDKALFFDGGETAGQWELVFRIVHHERMVFPGARMAAVSRQWDKMEVWTVGPGGLVHGNWFYERWHGWYSLPGAVFNPGSYLAALSRKPEHMEVWGVGSDGTVRGIWFDESWQQWYELPGATFPPGAQLVAVSRDGNHMEVFGVDIDGQVRSKFFDHGWKPEGGWQTLDGATFAPGAHLAAVSRAFFDEEVWVVGNDSDKPILSNRFVAGSWRGWRPTGGELFSPDTELAAVIRKRFRDLVLDAPSSIAEVPDVHVLAVDLNEHVRDFWYEGYTERGWFQAGVQFFNQGTPIAAVSREPRID